MQYIVCIDSDCIVHSLCVNRLYLYFVSFAHNALAVLVLTRKFILSVVHLYMDLNIYYYIFTAMPFCKP